MKKRPNSVLLEGEKLTATGVSRMDLMQTLGFDIYTSLETGTEVEARRISQSDVRIVSEFFHMSLFAVGDYLIQWPDSGIPHVISPEMFVLRYRKKDVEQDPDDGIGEIDLGRVHWDSPAQARSFALDMQHAIDHPEEMDEGRQLTPEEVAQAKAYIHKAKEYLAACNESL
jgi:hypothetical protein